MGQKLSYKNVLPSNIIAMANDSWVIHTGERLCTRGLRHALDSGTPDILVGMISLATSFVLQIGMLILIPLMVLK